MVSINPDITLVIQLINFIFALVVLNFLLIRPIRDIIKQRRNLINSLVADTAKFSDESSLRLKKYEIELDAARTQAAEYKEAVKQQGLDSEQAILESAQNEAHSFLQRSRKEVEQESAAAARVLRAQIDALAGKVVAKVLN